MDQTAKEKARQTPIARTKTTNKNSRLSNMQGRPSNNQGNNITFFLEDANGFKITPYQVILFCFVFVGLVVLLHVFGGSK